MISKEYAQFVIDWHNAKLPGEWRDYGNTWCLARGQGRDSISVGIVLGEEGDLHTAYVEIAAGKFFGGTLTEALSRAREAASPKDSKFLTPQGVEATDPSQEGSGERMWWADEFGYTCHPLDTAIEYALDALDEDEDLSSIELEEMRPSVPSDFPVGHMSDALWTRLADMFREDESMIWEDGGPEVDPYSFKDTPEEDGGNRPDLWSRLRDIIAAIAQEHVDLSESAWRPTGNTRTVKGDGR